MPVKAAEVANTRSYKGVSQWSIHRALALGVAPHVVAQAANSMPLRK